MLTVRVLEAVLVLSVVAVVVAFLQGRVLVMEKNSDSGSTVGGGPG